MRRIGFIVTVGGERLYFAGDTDHIPEMSNIRCDVALLPVGGTYTMDAEKAAQAAIDIRPKIAIQCTTEQASSAPAPMPSASAACTMARWSY